MAPSRTAAILNGYRRRCRQLLAVSIACCVFFVAPGPSKRWLCTNGRVGTRDLRNHAMSSLRGGMRECAGSIKFSKVLATYLDRAGATKEDIIRKLSDLEMSAEELRSVCDAVERAFFRKMEAMEEKGTGRNVTDATEVDAMGSLYHAHCKVLHIKLRYLARKVTQRGKAMQEDSKSASFEDAVSTFGTAFEPVVRAIAKDRVHTLRALQNRTSWDKGGEIVVFDDSVNWKPHFLEIEKSLGLGDGESTGVTGLPKFVIEPMYTKEQMRRREVRAEAEDILLAQKYIVTCLVHNATQPARVPLPPPVWGFSGKELQKVLGDEDVLKVGRTGLKSFHRTQESALNMVKTALAEHKEGRYPAEIFNACQMLHKYDMKQANWIWRDPRNSSDIYLAPLVERVFDYQRTN